MKVRHTAPRRAAISVICVLIVLTLAVLPVADRPGPAIAAINTLFVAGVLVIALPTSFLLFVRLSEARSWSLLLLACAYLHLGLMSGAYLATFPGALLPDHTLIGAGQTAAWIFVLWVGGYAVLSFLAVLADIRPEPRRISRVHVRLAVAASAAAVVATVAGIVVATTALGERLPPLMYGSSWSALNYVFSYGSLAIVATAVAVILAVAGRRNELLLWLAVALTAFGCANVMSLAGGGRFTIGWTAGRMSWLIAAGILFLYFMAQFARQQRALADARDALERRVESRTAALRESEARLRRAIESAPIPLMLHATDGEVLAISEAWSELTGYSRAELRTRFDWTRRAYPDNYAEVDAFIEQQFRLERAANTGERTIRTKDGGALVWNFTNVPLGQLADGRALTLTAVIDVTRRKQDEARQRLLAREVDHRSKNMLAVLQVMLRHTRAETVKDYAESVQGRVAAIARAHTLLAQSRWEGADLRALIKEEMAPYRKGAKERVRIEGPRLALAPAAAQSIAMAVHELATNAAKYGALSTPQGRVAVEWRLSAERGLEVIWEESGGPPVKLPARDGLGTGVIRRAIRDQLGGTVRFDWREQGLRCEIAVPAGEIGREVENGESRSGSVHT